MTLKPISDDKALAAIPLDEPVLVELEPGEIGGEVGDDESEKIVVVEPKIDAKTVKPDDPDAGVAALQKELDKSKEATKLAQTNEMEARRLAADRQRDLDAAKAQNIDTESNLIANSIDGARLELAAAKGAVKAAFEAGDAGAMADAQEKVGLATADLREFERAAEALKAKKDTPAPKKVQSIDEAIDGNPQLLPVEKTWMKEHPEVVLDGLRNQELGVAYSRAISAGHQRGTEAYFGFIDEFMGFKKAEPVIEVEEPEERTIVAAPVSRDRAQTINGKPSVNRVPLSPVERELASSLGVTDKEYAAEKLRMQADKQVNPERYAVR